jgi:hypothetical protein
VTPNRSIEPTHNGMGKTQFGVLAFFAAAALGPLYTVPGYSVASNVISELAVVCVAWPMLMLGAPAYQGITQRVMYLLVFAWLLFCYPRRAHA